MPARRVLLAAVCAAITFGVLVAYGPTPWVLVSVLIVGVVVFVVVRVT
ncbi:hypothetical protein ACVDFE_00045 [Lentzea chajnantorensis]